MITVTQASEYLDQALGVSVPDFIVEAAVTKVAPAEPLMDAAGYSEADKTMIQAMAVSIIAAAGAPRRITSQGAPSGASRSFKNFDDSLSALRRSLYSLDPARTVADLVATDPASAAFFMVV